ncbi:MAG: sigma 54-interacting transcriptional regulator [Deltaproteobacteria bacterium]|nr:sigma 54-interacting transcriptional regulator [Deltaproteobacteria bacterium]
MIFATNTNLETMVNKGLFREDFYYRIFVYPIMLPPLRERKMDILPIAYHFIPSPTISSSSSAAAWTNRSPASRTAPPAACLLLTGRATSGSYAT